MTDVDNDAAAAAEPIVVPEERTFWANLNHPFAAGFALTLGGLIAFALGVAFVNLSTIIIYIVFALFAALGLDPIVRLLERRGVKRGWAIVIVYLGFAVVLTAVLLLVIPAVVSQIAQFVRDIPSIIANFQPSPFSLWLQQNFADNVGEPLSAGAP